MVDGDRTMIYMSFVGLNINIFDMLRRNDVLKVSMIYHNIR